VRCLNYSYLENEIWVECDIYYMFLYCFVQGDLMSEASTSITEKAKKNRFKLIYHRHYYNVLAVTSLILGIFLLCFFVFDCYKNAGFINIVPGQVKSVTEISNNNYDITVSYQGLDGENYNATIKGGHNIATGEMVDLEVVSDATGQFKKVVFWDITSTFRYNALPFIGGFFVLVAIGIMYFLLNEFRLMIKLYSQKPIIGTFLGNFSLANKSELPCYKISVNGQELVIADNMNGASTHMQNNQAVSVLYYNGYFIVHAISNNNGKDESA
jgi:hypothetical protein